MEPVLQNVGNLSVDSVQGFYLWASCPSCIKAIVFHVTFNWLGYTILPEREKVYHKGLWFIQQNVNGPVLINVWIAFKALKVIDHQAKRYCIKSPGAGRHKSRSLRSENYAVGSPVNNRVRTRMTLKPRGAKRSRGADHVPSQLQVLRWRPGWPWGAEELSVKLQWSFESSKRDWTFNNWRGQESYGSCMMCF